MRWIFLISILSLTTGCRTGKTSSSLENNLAQNLQQSYEYFVAAKHNTEKLDLLAKAKSSFTASCVPLQFVSNQLPETGTDLGEILALEATEPETETKPFLLSMFLLRFSNNTYMPFRKSLPSPQVEKKEDEDEEETIRKAEDALRLDAKDARYLRDANLQAVSDPVGIVSHFRSAELEQEKHAFVKVDEYENIFIAMFDAEEPDNITAYFCSHFSDLSSFN